MNKAKINALYEQAHVVYETPYESSVVDPSIVSVHKQKVWDRYLFAELIVRECAEYAEHNLDMAGYKKKFMLKHFGVEE